jgi:hypothetical protein
MQSLTISNLGGVEKSFVYLVRPLDLNIFPWNTKNRVDKPPLQQTACER